MVVRLEIFALDRVLGELPKNVSEEIAHIAQSLDARNDAERTDGTGHLSVHEHCPWVQSALDPTRYVLVQPFADKLLDMIVLLTTTCGVSLNVEDSSRGAVPYLAIGKHARIHFTDRDELLFFLDQCAHLHAFLTASPPEQIDPTS